MTVIKEFVITTKIRIWVVSFFLIVTTVLPYDGTSQYEIRQCWLTYECGGVISKRTCDDCTIKTDLGDAFGLDWCFFIE